MNQTTHLSTTSRGATRRLISAFGALAVASVLHAATWADIQIGGFASQGYLVNSGDNDYLGETSEGSFDFREYAVNASYATGSFRVGAQAFGQKLGKYGDDKIILDWATIDWQPKQWFGVRAGRVKTPRGLYNEALDVDAIRPFVLLPQSVYDARLRDFNASFDGAMLFGNLGLGSVGSLDYKVFYGDIPMSIESGASDYFNNDVPYPNLEIGMETALGGTLFWNTPVNGLRVGYSYSEFQDFGVNREVAPGMAFYRRTDSYERHLASMEYLLGEWSFALEAGIESSEADVGPVGSTPLYAIENEVKYGYISAARRVGEKWEFGAYYSYSLETQNPIGFSLPFPDLEQNDYAVSAKYAINYNWLVKAEVHYMDGAGKIFTLPEKPQPFQSRDQSWTLLALKTTYSF